MNGQIVEQSKMRAAIARRMRKEAMP